MIVPEWLLEVIVVGALLVCTVAPLTLIVLLVRDWKKGGLW